MKRRMGPMAELRMLVFARQNKLCPICNLPMQEAGNLAHGMSLHHLTPQSLGGRWVLSNLAGLHRSCHDAIENEGDPRCHIARQYLENWVKSIGFYTSEMIEADNVSKTHSDVLLSQGRTEFKSAVRWNQ